MAKSKWGKAAALGEDSDTTQREKEEKGAFDKTQNRKLKEKNSC